MNDTLRVGLVQTAWQGSRTAMAAEIRMLIADTAHGGARVVCLPELTLSPYFPSSVDPAGFEWAEPLDGGESDSLFSSSARENHVWLIGSLFERDHDGVYRNTAVLYDPEGVRVGITRKVHIPSGEGYHETDFFVGGTEYPVHEVAGWPVAIPTCYDQWFPEMARICALNGAHFVFYPTAIGSEPTDPDFDSRDAWQTVMRGHAVANGIYVAAANRIGYENGLTLYGSSFICDPTGRVLASAGRDTREVIFADLSHSYLQRVRGLFPLLHQRKPAAYGRLTESTSTDVPKRWQDHADFKSE